MLWADTAVTRAGQLSGNSDPSIARKVKLIFDPAPLISACLDNAMDVVSGKSHVDTRPSMVVKCCRKVGAVISRCFHAIDSRPVRWSGPEAGDWSPRVRR